MTLFYTKLLRQKQDRIAEAALCCKEALRRRHTVIPDARDDIDLIHLFATSFSYIPRSGATSTRWGTSAKCSV